MTFKGVPQHKLVNKTITSVSRDSPYLRLTVNFLHTNQCNVDKYFRVSDARHSGFTMRIGLESGFILKDDISQSQYNFKPTWSILTVWQYFPFGLSPNKRTYYVASILNIQKCA